MTEEEKKKKKGMAIVIAVTPHAPKKPEDTSKPDEKMEKAWGMMKDSARYRPELDEKPHDEYDMMNHPDWHEDLTEDELFELAEKLQNDPHDADAWMGDESPEHFERMKELGFPKGGGPTSPFLDDEPEEEDDPMESWMEDEEKLKAWPMKKAWLVLKNANIANILADEEEGRDFAREVAGKPTQTDYQDKLSDPFGIAHYVAHNAEEEDEDYNLFEGHGIPTKPSEIPVEDQMDDVREEEEREEKLAEGVDPEEHKLDGSPDEDPLGMFSTTSDPIFNRDEKYHKEPSNPFGKTPMEGAWDSLKQKEPILGEEDFDLQHNNPGVRPSQTDEQRSENQMVSGEKRSYQQMKDEPKLQRRLDRREDLGRDS